MSNVAVRFYNHLKESGDLSPAQIVDFGLDGHDKEDLYDAYKKGVQKDLITLYDLKIAVGDGKLLTKLVQRVNPSLIVYTAWDYLEGELD